MAEVPGQSDEGLRVTTGQALLEEYAAIFEDGRDLADRPKFALCLSGGGIGSAAFSLGILQAFARARLLRHFHYLSTVSGGGYIGSLLAAVISRDGVAEAEAMLTRPGDPRIRGLREFTNYLTPSPGLASGDARAGILLWLRNTALNWAVFGPALLAIAILPTFYRNLLGGRPWGHWVAMALGLLLLLVSVFQACRSLPSHAHRPGPGPGDPWGVPSGTIRRWIVLPIIGWAMLAPLAALGIVRPESPSFFDHDYLLISGGSFAVTLVGYLAAAVSLGRRHAAAFIANLDWWILAALVSAVLLQLGFWLGGQIDLDPERRARLLTVVGPLWVIAVQVIQSGVYVGLRWSSAYGDLDREWLARLNGDKFVPVVIWSVLAGVTLLLVGPLLETPDLAYAGIVAFVAGPVGAWLGRSVGTLFEPEPPGGARTIFSRAALLDIVTLLVVLAFAAMLFMLLGALGTILVRLLASVIWTTVPEAALPWLIDVGGPGSFAAAVCFLAALALAWGLGARINVNRFSLHAVYRNRLVRAFLGATRPPEARHPDPYTGFDPTDNPRMADLALGAGVNGGRCLFPVVNTTMNLVATKRTAWAERRAAPFTITPLRCGAASLPDGVEPEGVYVRTSRYGGGETEIGEDDEGRGLTLGTAMTISGAAASPNMGYHSSAATAFLMTLFNVRLGAWLANPAVATPRQLNRAKPTNALLALFDEMMGKSDALSPNIYLSDGGHFDNLGLYEMLRRRCRLIVVVDATSDGDYHYGGLGLTLRRASIDLDAAVAFAAPLVKGETSLSPQGAYATIRYADGTGGELLCLKPWRPPDMPADVLAYWATHERFPHESTANQFFTESQFESYRHLGEHIGALAVGGTTDLAALFARGGASQPSSARRTSGG